MLITIIFIIKASVKYLVLNREFVTFLSDPIPINWYIINFWHQDVPHVKTRDAEVGSGWKH